MTSLCTFIHLNLTGGSEDLDLVLQSRLLRTNSIEFTPPGVSWCGSGKHVDGHSSGKNNIFERLFLWTNLGNGAVHISLQERQQAKETQQTERNFNINILSKQYNRKGSERIIYVQVRI